MRSLGLSTEVWVGSDQSCMLISLLGRLGVSGRMRVFVHSHISLLLAGLSSSRLQFPTPTIICWFYLTKGLKASRTVITMIVWVACPLAREVPAQMGQTVLPHSQPLQGISTHGKLNVQRHMAPVPWPQAEEPQRVYGGAWCPRKLGALPCHRWPCKGRLPVHKSNSTIHKHSLNLGQERQLGMLWSGNCNLLLSRKM